HFAEAASRLGFPLAEMTPAQRQQVLAVTRGRKEKENGMEQTINLMELGERVDTRARAFAAQHDLNWSGSEYDRALARSAVRDSPEARALADFYKPPREATPTSDATQLAERNA